MANVVECLAIAAAAQAYAAEQAIIAQAVLLASQTTQLAQMVGSFATNPLASAALVAANAEAVIVQEANQLVDEALNLILEQC